MSEDDFLLADFNGTARLFPLPNLVLFPQVVQPLHIFEPRYRQMTADALAGDRLIAMTLLRPDWDADYDQRLAIYPVGCLGKIIAEQRLDDGRYNLLLRGVARVRIVKEVAHEKLYRGATVEVCQETLVADEEGARHLRRLLTERARPWFEGQPAGTEQLERLLDNDLPLGVLCDVLAFALPLPPAAKQQLLEEGDVARRVRHLLKQLHQSGQESKTDGDGRKFPPDFSAN